MKLTTPPCFQKAIGCFAQFSNFEIGSDNKFNARNNYQKLNTVFADLTQDKTDSDHRPFIMGTYKTVRITNKQSTNPSIKPNKQS